jgi:hypothetical protein
MTIYTQISTLVYEAAKVIQIQIPISAVIQRTTIPGIVFRVMHGIE